ncbi:uncharacterized protein [Dermacentor albipictus]|uniref:uncharacterized protein isoform X4 n=1 Tax=Dermacentor albipictus TaxID=60249 RepID=UPI0031FC72A9
MGAVALRGQRPESRPTERRPVGGRDGPPEVAAAGKARWPLGDGVKGLALLGHDAVDDEPPSPARPPPVLVGEQVRNLPKARQPSIMAPAAGEHGLRTQFYGRKSVCKTRKRSSCDLSTRHHKCIRSGDVVIAGPEDVPCFSSQAILILFPFLILSSSIY